MANNNFVDPLDDIMNRVQNESNESNGGIKIPPMPSNIKLPPDEEERVTVTKADPPEINYGDDDIENEYAEKERIEAEERARQAKENAIAREENKPEEMAPEMYDEKAIGDEVAHQGNTLDTVAAMVRQVAIDYRLPSGGIPEVNPSDKRDVNFKMRIMGDLVECYHRDGAVITDTFRNTVLDNWYLDSGVKATTYVNNGFKETLETPETENNETPDTVKEVEIPANPTININVEPGTPVTVNIDDDIVGEMSKQQVVDIFVKEVTEQDLLKGNIVVNSDADGIIAPYDPGLEDIPVTLPTSGYRCIIRPFSWFEIVSLMAPTGRNIMDIMMRQWSIIYDHIKWTSIGPFKSFEDFTEKTRFIDLQFFMWAILVSTSAEEEDITLTCGNEDCKHSVASTYRPREIMHIDEEKIPDYYEKVDKAAPGPEAAEIFNKIVATHKGYELPDSKVIVELNAPTVKDFIEGRFGRIREIYERFYPDGNFNTALPRILSNFQKGQYENGGEFAILLGAALLVAAVYIPYKGKMYKYEKFDQMEKILTKQLSFKDSYLLFYEIFPKANMFDSPVSFWLPGYICPKCGRNNVRVPIDDIGESLLFLLSRRYQNTTINLKELPEKS